jgi:integrase
MVQKLARKGTRSRKSRGSVNIQENSGGLRLRWSYAGKPYSLTLGLKASDPQHYKLAEAKAREIESDIIYERFDPTLVKYDPRRRVITLVEEKAPLFPIYLPELWSQYIRYKNPLVEETTIRTHYYRVSRHIDRLPYKKLSEALEIRQHLLENHSLKTTKFLLMELQAACNWAVKRRIIDHSPFAGMALEIEIDLDDQEPDPFSSESRNTIIQAFGQHPVYKYYQDFVWFLFYSGCRTSEAVALRWEHIDPEATTITFSEAIVNVSSRRILKGTKTGRSRKFPCNDQMQEFLIRRRKVSDRDYVFPSLSGKPINTHSFSALCWKGTSQHGVWKNGIVTQLEKDRLIDRYRSLYSTRHTFISKAIEAGMPIHHVARICGNSPEILVKHYLGVTAQITIPKL